MGELALMLAEVILSATKPSITAPLKAPLGVPAELKSVTAMSLILVVKIGIIKLKIYTIKN